MKFNKKEILFCLIYVGGLCSSFRPFFVFAGTVYGPMKTVVRNICNFALHFVIHNLVKNDDAETFLLQHLRGTHEQLHIRILSKVHYSSILHILEKVEIMWAVMLLVSTTNWALPKISCTWCLPHIAPYGKLSSRSRLQILVNCMCVYRLCVFLGSVFTLPLFGVGLGCPRNRLSPVANRY